MTMKRELGLLTGDVDVDTPRTKRRKEQVMGTTQSTTTLPVETTNVSSDPATHDEERANGGQDGLREQASRMWQMVKDAVNKEGNICSPPFMRLPLKRHYPDYYDVIAQPICLDDIRKKIDEGRYPALDQVRQDFELCFTNAKRYNLKDSPIWLDAKFLLKVANKEYTKITGKKVKKSGDPDGDGEEKADGEGDDDKKKNKPQNMNRLLKTRLQKMVEKTDEETHRVLSDVFMEMPSKKDYPTYYKEIKRPMCIENIFRRLKRKEYNTADEFANDVELVFSNALIFNLEHSQIWEDAITLRDYFRQLMSDLPSPHVLPRYAKSSGKIRFKVPGAGGVAMAAATPQNELKPSQDQTASNPLTLRLPAASSLAPKSPHRAAETLPRASSTSSVPAAPSLAPTPTPVPASASESATAPAHGSTSVPSSTVTTPTSASTPLSVSATAAAPPPPSKVAAPTPKIAIQPLAYATPTQYTHYPNAAYRQATQPVATPQPSTSAATPSAQARSAHSVSRSPPPSLSGHRHLKEVSIITKPRGRPLWLDHRDGVKTWAIRLAQRELSLSIVDVKFLGEEDKESSDEELRDLAEEEEEEEEEEEPVPKRRGRGRPARNPKAKAKAPGKRADRSVKKAPARITPPHENIQVILNGTPTTTKPDQRVWEVEPQIGSNVLEIGEKGGHLWKVYLERPSVT